MEVLLPMNKDFQLPLHPSSHQSLPYLKKKAIYHVCPIVTTWEEKRKKKKKKKRCFFKDICINKYSMKARIHLLSQHWGRGGSKFVMKICNFLHFFGHEESLQSLVMSPFTCGCLIKALNVRIGGFTDKIFMIFLQKLLHVRFYWQLRFVSSSQRLRSLTVLLSTGREEDFWISSLHCTEDAKNHIFNHRVNEAWRMFLPCRPKNFAIFPACMSGNMPNGGLRSHLRSEGWVRTVCEVRRAFAHSATSSLTINCYLIV